MKTLIKIYLLILAMLPLGSCEQREPEVEVRRIPEEDRLVFEKEFRIYWSLKYGIIRFEGEIGETDYTWDLEIYE